jgi:hypothetical protein
MSETNPDDNGTEQPPVTPPPAEPPAAPPETDAERALRIAGSYGAQVVLDQDSDEALAARGALHGTIEANTMARDKALVDRAGEAPVVTVMATRDPVHDPENDHVVAARKATGGAQRGPDTA